MKKEHIEICLGIIICAVAYYLAFIPHYERFYSFLIIGMFLILKGLHYTWIKRRVFDKKGFLLAYSALFIFGIIADLIFGLWITKLWYYPSYTVLNYILLYVLIYPFGGLILVYMFDILEHYVIKKPQKTHHKKTRTIAKIILVLGCIGAILSLIIEGKYFGFFLYLSVSLMGLGLINMLTLKIKKINLLEKWTAKGMKYSTIILLVAYVQGIIHEYPNVFVKEWVYQNFPFQETLFMGIPITVLFLGWIFLVIMPYSMCELILAYARRKIN